MMIRLSIKQILITRVALRRSITEMEATRSDPEVFTDEGVIEAAKESLEILTEVLDRASR